MKNRELIISKIFVGKKLIHKACKKDWYIKHDLIYIYDMIFSNTSFLKEDISIRERIFYIENNLESPVICPHCKENILKFNQFKVNFAKHCNSIECKSKHTKELMELRYKSMTDIDRKLSCVKLVESSKKRGIEIKGKTLLELYGKEKSDKIIQEISNASLNVSNDTTKKRIETRKNGLNGQSWHTEYTRKLISDTNKKTWANGKLHKKYKSSYEIAARKQSILMKKRILDGSFTPCITNSWTRWKSYVELESGEIRKFRSNWEAIFWLLNQNTIYEDVRILYTDNIGNDRSYIVDFHDDINKKIYEIKPRSLKFKSNNILKEKSAIDWCKKNNHEYICIDDNWMKENAWRVDLLKHPYLEKTIAKLK